VAAIDKKDKYQLLYVGDGSKAGRLAVESDVQAGATPAPGDKHISLGDFGVGNRFRDSVLYRGPEQQYLDKTLHEYSRTPSFKATGCATSTICRSSSGCFIVGAAPICHCEDIKRRSR